MTKTTLPVTPSADWNYLHKQVLQTARAALHALERHLFEPESIQVSMEASLGLLSRYLEDATALLKAQNTIVYPNSPYVLRVAETVKEIYFCHSTVYFHQRYGSVWSYETDSRRRKRILYALRRAKGALEEAWLISSAYLSLVNSAHVARELAVAQFTADLVPPA